MSRKPATDLFLSSDEIVDLTGKVWHELQVDALKAMGIPHRIRPDGRILVVRQYITGGQAAEAPKPAEPTPPRLRLEVLAGGRGKP